VSAVAASVPTLGAACAGCLGASIGAATLAAFISPRNAWQPFVVIAAAVVVTMISRRPFRDSSIIELATITIKTAASAAMIYVAVIGILTVSQLITTGPGSGPVLP
jgi:hypothetical protein